MAAPRIQLIISESNISIPNNTSILTGTLYYYGNGETYNQNTPCSITINGDTKSFTVSIAKNTSGVIGSHSVTVTHDADGNKTVNYSAVVNASAHYGATTTSGSYVCTWIKRATQPSLSPAAVKYGESTTISLPRADSGFVHDLYYSVGNGWVKFKSSAGASYTWTVPKTLATSGKESPTKTIVIRAVTLSGGSSVGEKTVNLSVNPSADMVPGLSIKIEDTTGNYTKFGAYVRAQSKIKCTLTETLSYESPIKSRSIEIDGVKYTQNPATSNVIAYTDKSVTATITDGRGMSTTKSVKPAVLDWWAPTVTRFSVARCNSAGTLQADGAYTRVDYAVKIAPLNNKNTKLATVRYKKQSDTSWQSKTAAVDGYTYQDYVVLPTSSEFTYDIELSVSDHFTTTQVPGVIGTAFILMDWHASGKGMAIGKVAEHENIFEIGLKTQATQDLTVDGNSTFGTSFGGGTTAPTAALGGMTTLTEVGGGRKFFSRAQGTGLLKIVLPQDFIKTFIKFDVEIWSYDKQAICTYSIAGQPTINSSTGTNQWSYRVVNVQGVGGSNLPNLDVIFGGHNGRAAIAIGAEDTAWDYCMIAIRNVETSYVKYGVGYWQDGWEIIIDANPLDEPLHTNTNPQSRVLSGMGVADYIVAQGTSGIWTWRKWNSGVAECWSNPTSNTTYSLTSKSEYGYYCNSEIAIPTVVDFISAPAITASACGTTGLTTVNISGIGNTKIGFRPYCTTSLSWSGKIFFNCKGRWK